MAQTLCPGDAVSGHLRLQPTAPAAAPLETAGSLALQPGALPALHAAMRHVEHRASAASLATRTASSVRGGLSALDPSEEGQHILRYESERTVVADRHILDAIAC
jgi:hypothetical protein